MNTNPSHNYRKLLFILIAIDLIFIALHISRGIFGFPQKSAFSIAQERGYAEIYQYLKELSVAFMLYKLGELRREKLYLSWSFMYLYIFLDDFIGLHELGGRLSTTILPNSLPLNIQVNDLGEVLFSLAAFGICGLLILIAYLRSKPDIRRTSHPLILLLFLLIFTGGALDFVHSLVSIPVIWDILGLLEDGGEMLVMSFTVYYTVCLLKPDFLVEE